ncbi:MAG: HEAT repeat domain-containing protein, partial [Planctomycetota bacterium]
MLRLTAAALFFLVSTVSARCAEPAPVEPTDTFGRPLPWGQDVRLRKIGLYTPLTKLVYGQPLEVELRSFNPEGKAPLLRFRRRGPLYRIELRTAPGGEEVTHKCRILSGGYGMTGNCERLRLTPTGKFARGRYLGPGRYHLKITFDLRREPTDPCAWLGKIETNALEITVLEKFPDDPVSMVPAKLRARAEPLIAELDAEDAATRQKAFKALEAVNSPELLPLLEKAAASKSAEVSDRSRQLMWATLQVMVERSEGATKRGMPARHVIGPMLAGLREPGWRLLEDKLKPAEVKGLRVLAARFGPVDTYRDMSAPDGAAARKIAERLGSKDPVVRVRAVRSLSRTKNAVVLEALVRRLGDTHSYTLRGLPGMPAPSYPIALEAGWAIEWQGRPAIGPLVDLCRGELEKGNRRLLYRGLPLLGPLDFDPRSLKLLGDVLKSGEHGDRCSATEALGRFGPPAQDLLMEAAASGKQNSIIRREALEALAKCGSPEKAGDLVLKMM